MRSPGAHASATVSKSDRRSRRPSVATGRTAAVAEHATGSQAAVALLLVGMLAACQAAGGDPSPAPDAAGPGADAAPESDWFVDRAAETGLDFFHVNGATGEFHPPEATGPGAALLDYDNDGDLDVFLTQGGVLTPGELLVPPPPGTPPGDRLYRNDLEMLADGTGRLRFTDVSASSGIVTRGFGQGVAAGDYDNDGWVDLYLPGFERNQMFRNNGDGTFAEVSVQTGTDSPSTWGVSAAFVDVDHDGWLDLFVGNYLEYSLAGHLPCVNFRSQPDYCAPSRYTPQQNRFYRNRGDGTFDDATEAAGFVEVPRPTLGITSADFNGDGWIDLFIANDLQENHLWINRGDGTFENLAPLSGVALDAAGKAKADMGVDAGDFDNDGDEDLFMTDLTAEGSTLFVNDGTGIFVERSAASGMLAASFENTGFGAAWFDFDNDGLLDILAVNGLIFQDMDAVGAGDPYPFDQPNQLFRNAGDGRFDDVTAEAGAVFALSEVSRGAAFGDIDNDGDTDVVVGNDAGPARLLVNEIGNRRHWVGLRLIGADGKRDMVGARVAVIRADGSTLWRRARADGSYASANDPRVLVGLGDSAEPVRVRVTWPSRRVEEWADVPVDTYHTLREGSGR